MEASDRAEYIAYAEDLEKAAVMMRQVANGYIDSHSEDVKPLCYRLKNILCWIAASWI